MNVKSLVCMSLSLGLLAACNNDSSTSTTTDSTTTMTTDNTMMTDTAAGNSTMTSNAPLDTMDKTFAMKAASGGMMEVQAANLIMQNGASERVKGFASMMIRDHGQANDQLKSIAAAKNLTLPTAPMPEHQKHLDMMKGMSGKALDKHYMDMMVKDHVEDVSAFEKASGNAKDADVKNFATQTLPVLKTHLDSARAISKAKI